MLDLLSQFFVVNNTFSSYLVRIFVSFLVGAFMGLERKLRMQFVGMRTLILISVSSCLVMLISIHLSREMFPESGDPGRIAAQVISGIGFLGGGAILREGFNVKGLTSAAIIWTAAGLGLAIGAGFYIPAFLTFIFCIISLVLIELFEDRFFPAEELKNLHIVCNTITPSYLAMKKLASKYGIVCIGIKEIISFEDKNTEVVYTIRIPKNIDFPNFFERIRKEFNITDIILR